MCRDPDRPRTLNPDTGRVMVKFLRNLHNDTITKREKSYAQDIDTIPVSGEVDLF